ncbi:MAG: hypothetical protein MO846_02585 [Candidatus Devosia symbiotica]|nr:hypothetical protein [Candidatus Devosia symbiotica]
MDPIIVGFDEVCQEQLHAFAVARWPSVKHEPMLFLLNAEVVGGLLMMAQALSLRLEHIAVSKWRSMLKDLSRPDCDAIHAGIVEALIADHARQARADDFSASLCFDYSGQRRLCESGGAWVLSRLAIVISQPLYRQPAAQ